MYDAVRGLQLRVDGYSLRPLSVGVASGWERLTPLVALFELGPGRGQIQVLARIFHSDAPNDVAPSGFNAADLSPGLPTSPMAPQIATTGFRWSGDS